MEMYADEDISSRSICNNCLLKFKKNEKYSLCILNNMIVPSVPQEIQCLNMYEKILIQRAKAFQTLQKKGTVMKKKLPNYVKIDSLKGLTIHLPLPTEETLQKICPDTNPLNLDHEMYILVRSHPTKGKKIWEDYVDIKKVWNSLT